MVNASSSPSWSLNQSSVSSSGSSSLSSSDSSSSLRSGGEVDGSFVLSSFVGGSGSMQYSDTSSSEFVVLLLSDNIAAWSACCSTSSRVTFISGILSTISPSVRFSVGAMKDSPCISW